MRAVRTGFYLGVLLLPGCSVGDKLINNLIIEPAHYDRYTDNWARCLRDKDLANEAWAEVCSRDGEVYSRHYYRGFIEGFRDYLDKGGTGEPPALPPRSYWRIYFQTPEGHAAIQDWFTGFRHGADIARASGVRELVLVPISSVPPPEISDIVPNGGEQSPPGGMTPTGPVERLPGPPAPVGPVRPTDGREPRQANGKPMPPPTPPVIQVERMIAPPIPKSNPK